MRSVFQGKLPLLMVVLAAGLFGQGPSGNDINQAIPIQFGQTINDIGDSSQVPSRVYKVTLARGQAFSVTATSSGNTPFWRLLLLAPSTLATATATREQVLVDTNNTVVAGLAINYQVAAAGTYYVMLVFLSNGVSYKLQANATGTPIAVPNPTSAGCLSGKVDSITYSLQYIALGLPDEVTIGGTRACAACTTKPPLYPEISSRLENAMNAGGSVEACFDSSGNIFQLKLVRP